MRVKVSSNSYPRVPQPLANYLEVYSFRQHEAGMGMA